MLIWPATTMRWSRCVLCWIVYHGLASCCEAIGTRSLPNSDKQREVDGPLEHHSLSSVLSAYSADLLHAAPRGRKAAPIVTGEQLKLLQ